MKEVERYIYNQVAQKQLAKESAKEMLLEVKDMETHKTHKDMAIIGLACRLPGADTPDKFWSNIQNSKSCLVNFPTERAKEWMDMYTNKTLNHLMTGLGRPETVEDVLNNVTIGGFLDDISKFDSGFFGLSPKEAKFMSPEQKLMLEVAWESIEDAGYGGNKIYGTNTGVFIGKDNSNLGIYKYVTQPDVMQVTGSWNGIIASRISYLYNLKGPSMIVDTACSSGLVSLHMASKAINNGECDMAIVGGLQLQYLVDISDYETNLSMVESDSGEVRTFDKKANGTVWSEGIVSILIKDLDAAIRDHDNIHAIVKGSAINNDGASNGITAPDARAQEDVICNAWKDSGVDPETISYFEAHGTGTILGDPIEIKGLTNAFRKYTDKKQFCAIGSAKANIGHTVAASGLAGVIKIIYAMKHKLLPPSINFSEVNPYIDFMNSPVYLNDTLREWNTDSGVMRAGINSFGFSGTNCHVVLEEPPKREAEETDSKERVIFLSAKSEASITELCNRYIKYLNNETSATVDEICYTANTGRGHYNYRVAVICTDKESLKAGIQTAYSSMKNQKELSTDTVFYDYFRLTNAEVAMGEKEITESQLHNLTNMLSTLQKEENRNLKEICNLYVQGANIDFDDFYGEKKFTRVSVPTYVYDDKRCYAEKKVFEPDNTVQGSFKNMDHPLFDRLLVDSMDTTIYETDLSTEKHWILTEHVFMGTSIVPGTSYIEMAREVCQRYFHTENIEFENLIFLTPVSVPKDEIVTLQTVLRKTSDGATFTFCSKNKEGKWITHAQGKGMKTKAPDRKYNIQELKDRLNILLYENQDGRYYKTDKRNAGNEGSEFFKFGDRWRRIVTIYGDERYVNEVLVMQDLTDKYAEDIDRYYLHPSLIDNAINHEICILDDVYLPFVYKTIKIYRKTGKKVFSHIIRKNPEIEKPETANYDVVLFDEEGNIIAEVESYSLKRMSLDDQNKFQYQNSNRVPYFHKVWKMDQDNANKGEIPSFDGEQILLFEDANEKGEKLGALLKQQGANVFSVKQGTSYEKLSENEYESGTEIEDYLALFGEMKQKHITRIVHCMGCDCYDEDYTTDEKLDKGLFSMFNLTKALLQSKMSSELTINVVCEYANRVNGSEPFVYAENNALIAITRVVGAEYTNYKTACIDIDEMTDYSNLLYDFEDTTNHYAAYRENVRYIEELERYGEEDIVHNCIKIRENGIYLIAGGAGALGLEVSKYLASEAKVNLILLNRTKLPERKYWSDIIADNSDKALAGRLSKIKEIESSGSRVYPYGTDISDERDLAGVIAEVSAKFGKIDGIIQAAGVAGNGFIMNKSRYVFDKVVKPKIYGTILLDKLTKDMDLDFMLCYSSIASSLPSAGQSDYTAANAFLDSFADERNLKGKCTKVINWPAWKEIGMAADNKFSNADNLFMSIDTERAMEAFADILKSDIQKVIPSDMNFVMPANSVNLLPLKLSDELLASVKEVETDGKNDTSKEKKEDGVTITLSGRGTQYSDTERKVAAVWGEVLDIDEVNIYDNFNSLGGDSILASQIYSKMQKVFPGMTDITDIFTYSTISSFAEYVASKIKPEAGAKTEEKEDTKTDTGTENNFRQEHTDKRKDPVIEKLIENFELGSSSLNEVIDKFSEIIKRR